MAMFGLPGGNELWIIALVLVVLLARIALPVLLVVLVVWLVRSRRGPVGTSSVPAGWLVDPTGRHEVRYWDGSIWTRFVSDAGVQSEDAL